ncbi:hypothetical protein EVG20_g8161 [Dentipellis fragilis]|uniref:Uncharacterized protein n=1 Tax=Dentipellis fragilis TaxID=205917 RepID=A0A4Y9Y8A8_9AGAM|nr:hypothetical protein EVG20_g8161 [Dentipellis fragilis]
MRKPAPNGLQYRPCPHSPASVVVPAPPSSALPPSVLFNPASARPCPCVGAASSAPSYALVPRPPFRPPGPTLSRTRAGTQCDRGASPGMVLSSAHVHRQRRVPDPRNPPHPRPHVHDPAGGLERCFSPARAYTPYAPPTRMPPPSLLCNDSPPLVPRTPHPRSYVATAACSACRSTLIISTDASPLSSLAPVQYSGRRCHAHVLIFHLCSPLRPPHSPVRAAPSPLRSVYRRPSHPQPSVPGTQCTRTSISCNPHHAARLAYAPSLCAAAIPHALVRPSAPHHRTLSSAIFSPVPSRLRSPRRRPPALATSTLGPMPARPVRAVCTMGNVQHI